MQCHYCGKETDSNYIDGFIEIPICDRCHVELILTGRVKMKEKKALVCHYCGVFSDGVIRRGNLLIPICDGCASLGD